MSTGARYSLSGTTASRSPTKAAGGGGATRRLSTVDTASSKRPGSAAERPEERVKVFVRVRPTKPEGETPGALKVKPDGKGIVIFREHATIPSSEFEFDRVLGPAASQSDVYHAAVKPIVEDVLNGYNGTLMAYGQTGAGKTYSLSSIAKDSIGMIPRAAAEIFSHIEQDSSHEYTVYMSYVQLYMELIQDLLRPESENLQIRENEGGVFVSGVHQQEVTNITQCLHLLHLGDRNRTTAFTALNAHSSRSHAVVMLTVIKRRCVAGTGEAEIQRVKVGKLFLVDLAGSERLKKSKSTGLRATEAKSINLSLTTLGMCINARADPTATHVPFRDSKLTRLLQDSLGGNAKTSLLVATCDAVEHVDETLQSLQFGARAMCVRIQAVVNERVDYKTLHAEMVAALASQDQKSSLLEATLLEKDAQLEAVQAQLQQEQQENVRRVQELQREREQLEAERARLVQAQEVALQAEHQQKQALMQQLEASSAETQGLVQQHEQQRQQLLATVAEQQRQLAAAQTAAAEAEQRHAEQLEAQRQAAGNEQARAAAEHEAALQQLQQQHKEEQAAAAAAHEEVVAALRQELARTRQLLTGSREESRILQEHQEQQLRELEDEWSRKLRDAEAASARQVAAVQATVAVREGTITQLQQDLEARDGSIVQLNEVLAALEAGKAELARQVAALQAQLEAAGRQRRQLEAAFAQEQQHVADLQAQVEGYERSRMALAKSFFENKMRSDAAKVIQRHWREHRLQRMRRQQTEGYQALNNAKAMLGTLAQQHAELEQRRRANLAFSGQTLVGDNLDVLQDAVESIITAFLLPARDLKTIQRYQQKVSAYSAAPLARQSMAPLPAGTHGGIGVGGGAAMHLPLSRTNTSGDLIKAVNPLADSVPSSARSTPREVGGDPQPAGLAQQQQQYQQQLPPGRPLSRPGSLGSLPGGGAAPGGAPSALQQQAVQHHQQQHLHVVQQGQGQAAQQRGVSREGSFRGGLASLAGKVMGSPLDRLRRLSSGQYQQQPVPAPQQYHHHY